MFGTVSSVLRSRNIVEALTLQKINAAISFVGPAAGGKRSLL